MEILMSMDQSKDGSGDRAATCQPIVRKEKTYSAKDAESYDYAISSLDEEEMFHFLGFEFLQRLNIVRIQNDLIELKAEIMSTKGQYFAKEKLSKLLEEYTTAVRNYNYTHQAPRMDHETRDRRKQRLKHKCRTLATSLSKAQPFESHYYYLHDMGKRPGPDILRDKLRQWLPSRLSYSAQERLNRVQEFNDGKAPIEISPFVDNLVRLLISSVAMLALVVPMWIMSVDPSRNKNLITASVCTVLFACVLSFAVKTSNVETLVATATYSAVLVVFVGASLAPSSK